MKTLIATTVFTALIFTASAYAPGAPVMIPLPPVEVELPPEPTPEPTPEPVPTIDGMPYKAVVTRKVTGYTPAPSENGGYSVTSLGKPLKGLTGKIVAVSRKDLKLMPYGTRVYIDGIGVRTVADTGCRSGVVDVLVAGNTYKVGNKVRRIYVLDN